MILVAFPGIPCPSCPCYSPGHRGPLWRLVARQGPAFAGARPGPAGHRAAARGRLRLGDPGTHRRTRHGAAGGAATRGSQAACSLDEMRICFMIFLILNDIMILIKTLIYWKETSSGHGDFGELVNGNPLGSFSGIKMDTYI